MDFFTKNKMLFWCVVILVLLNIVTLGSFWLGKPHRAPLAGPGGQQDGQKIMAERLGLSEEQAEQVERIRNEHFMRTRPLQDDMHKIRLDLLNEIFKDEPDEVKIQEMFSEIGDKQVRFEKNLYRHFQELKEVCSPQQMQELKMMLRDLIERTRPRDLQHHRPGPRGEFGPGRQGEGPGADGGFGPGMPPEHLPPPLQQ